MLSTFFHPPRTIALRSWTQLATASERICKIALPGRTLLVWKISNSHEKLCESVSLWPTQAFSWSLVNCDAWEVTRNNRKCVENSSRMSAKRLYAISVKTQVGFHQLFLDVSENYPAGGENFWAISTDLQSGMLSGNSESHLRSPKKSRAYRRERVFVFCFRPDFSFKNLETPKSPLKK